jgi:peptide/nickel transport system substrate-binding protein
MGERRFAMTLSRFGCPTGDASDLLENALHSPDAGRAVGLSNYTGYASRDVDRLVEEAARTLEMSRRQAILFDATARAMEELPIVPVYIDQDLYAFRAGVEWRPRNDNFLIASEIAKAP